MEILGKGFQSRENSKIKDTERTAYVGMGEVSMINNNPHFAVLYLVKNYIPHRDFKTLNCFPVLKFSLKYTASGTTVIHRKVCILFSHHPQVHWQLLVCLELSPKGSGNIFSARATKGSRPGVALRYGASQRCLDMDSRNNMQESLPLLPTLQPSSSFVTACQGGEGQHRKMLKGNEPKIELDGKKYPISALPK